MPVKVIYKNRRSGKERRKRFSTHEGTERRSGVDRRTLDEKLKQMVENSAKVQNKEKQKTAQTSSGKVIIRRKGESDTPSSE